MAVQLEVAQFDNSQVKNFLKNLNQKLADVKDGKNKYVGLLSAIVYKDVNSHFEEEKGPKGKWKAWSSIYQQHMKAVGKQGNKILQDSGRLRNNFKPTKVKSSSNGILWFNDAKTKSGFGYAGAHDNGSGNLPQRDFMWLSDDGLESVSRQTLQFMLDEGI